MNVKRVKNVDYSYEKTFNKGAKMKKIKMLARSMAAGMASFGCFFPSFDLSTKNAVNMDSPDVGVEAAFSDVKEAFQVASDCLQNGIDNVSK